MSDVTLSVPSKRKQGVELSYEERIQLNTIIDLLIPSDEDFPAPSSLHLIDDFLHHLSPSAESSATKMLSIKRLHTVLRDLNISAGGLFCAVSTEKQQKLLMLLERREPAVYQALWTLASHSYYKHLATIRHARLA